MKKHNTQGYSVIISLLLIGFLLVLTTTVFNLVLRELRDTRGLGNSIKAFAGAESAQELALLKIKEKGYGVDAKVDMNTDSGRVLASDVNNINKNKDVLISYDLDITTTDYTETLPTQGYSIIPLFVEQNGTTSYVRDYNLFINSGTDSLLVWNLISGDKGISGIGSETRFGDGKQISNTTGESYFIGDKSISNFLSDNNINESYLILFNSGNSNISFRLRSAQSFSKPKTQIISSAQVGDYRHNLQTDYDNTEFLNMLKYSVLSK